MDRSENRMVVHDRWRRVAAGFLAVSYGIGAPLTAFLEFRSHTMSQRFGLPSELIYVTCAVQLVCAVGVLVGPFVSWAAAALTITTLGAIASHLRIGSPVTALLQKSACPACLCGLSVLDRWP